MSAPTTLGLPLPITATFALPLSLYYLLLQTRVVRHRLATRTIIAHQITSSPSDPLLAAVRAQTNFAENVPLALILAGVVESNGGSKRVLAYALGALVALRVAHADFGIMREGYLGWGRPMGYFGTQVVVAWLAGWAGWLSLGYWGL
ncbi:hypothetical protein PRZ48_009069 [Zasmidium cellare]|uniref:Uncharacterized protein n=1 Tax=Zasmidium cellare TaxID=395010 RepID=A0ABR0EHB9_ZASCE|nr:hypothetical protein PRZ48_009069 [Zasmidium cellare]